MRIWYLVGNSGDGSSSVRFLDSQEAVDHLIETDPDTYSDGDGGSYGSFDCDNFSGELDTLDTIKAEQTENA
jgi:hypothetical protein